MALALERSTKERTFLARLVIERALLPIRAPERVERVLVGGYC
ncbi:MAG TPA: hypothetical protein VEJ23_10075 [Solirubrobacteraceae bacterium]|nr:hypothetical protein [Solirubrobacteraceae bacterium]